MAPARVFISCVDGYLGASLLAAFAATFKNATFVGSSASSNGSGPRAGSAEALDLALSCDLVVVDLLSAIGEAKAIGLALKMVADEKEAALKAALKNAGLPPSVSFEDGEFQSILSSQQHHINKAVLVLSSTLVWDGTEHSSHLLLQESSWPYRRPHPAAAEIRDAEVALLSLVKPDLSLRVHTVACGLPYGGGAGPLFSLLQQAWETRPFALPPSLLESFDGATQKPKRGSAIPAIHIKDLASFAARVATNSRELQPSRIEAFYKGAFLTSPSPASMATASSTLTARAAAAHQYGQHGDRGQLPSHTKAVSGGGQGCYYVAVDASCCDLPSLLQGIAGRLGNGRVSAVAAPTSVPGSPSILGDGDATLSHSSATSLYLSSFSSSSPGPARCGGFDQSSLAIFTHPLLQQQQWHSREGPVVNATLVCNEFLLAHRLKPKRLLLLGPPGSGESRLAMAVARKYSLPLITPQIATAALTSKGPGSWPLERLSDGTTLRDKVVLQLRAAVDRVVEEHTKAVTASKDAEKEAAAAAASGANTTAADPKAKGGKADPKAAAKGGAKPAPSSTTVADEGAALPTSKEPPPPPLSEILALRGPLLPRSLLTRALRAVLTSPECRNRGYVLSGFPRTAADCESLFGVAEVVASGASTLLLAQQQFQHLQTAASPRGGEPSTDAEAAGGDAASPDVLSASLPAHLQEALALEARPERMFASASSFSSSFGISPFPLVVDDEASLSSEGAAIILRALSASAARLCPDLDAAQIATVEATGVFGVQSDVLTLESAASALTAIGLPLPLEFLPPSTGLSSVAPTSLTVPAASAAGPSNIALALQPCAEAVFDDLLTTMEAKRRGGELADTRRIFLGNNNNCDSAASDVATEGGSSAAAPLGDPAAAASHPLLAGSGAANTQGWSLSTTRGPFAASVLEAARALVDGGSFPSLLPAAAGAVPAAPTEAAKGKGAPPAAGASGGSSAGAGLQLLLSPSTFSSHFSAALLSLRIDVARLPTVDPRIAPTDVVFLASNEDDDWLRARAVPLTSAPSSSSAPSTAPSGAVTTVADSGVATPAPAAAASSNATALPPPKLLELEPEVELENIAASPAALLATESTTAGQEALVVTTTTGHKHYAGFPSSFTRELYRYRLHVTGGGTGASSSGETLARTVNGWLSSRFKGNAAVSMTTVPVGRLHAALAPVAEVLSSRALKAIGVGISAQEFLLTTGSGSGGAGDSNASIDWEALVSWGLRRAHSIPVPGKKTVVATKRSGAGTSVNTKNPPTVSASPNAAVSRSRVPSLALHSSSQGGGDEGSVPSDGYQLSPLLKEACVEAARASGLPLSTGADGAFDQEAMVATEISRRISATLASALPSPLHSEYVALPADIACLLPNAGGRADLARGIISQGEELMDVHTEAKATSEEGKAEGKDNALWKAAREGRKDPEGEATSRAQSASRKSARAVLSSPSLLMADAAGGTPSVSAASLASALRDRLLLNTLVEAALLKALAPSLDRAGRSFYPTPGELFSMSRINAARHALRTSTAKRALTAVSREAEAIVASRECEVYDRNRAGVEAEEFLLSMRTKGMADLLHSQGLVESAASRMALLRSKEGGSATGGQSKVGEGGSELERSVAGAHESAEEMRALLRHAGVNC